MQGPSTLPEPFLPSTELSFADFGDLRLTLRLCAIADALAACPSDSMPHAMKTEAALEGAYRFFGNRHVTPERILEPHVASTIARASATRTFLALHDTTQFEFDDPVQARALGLVRGNGNRGFLSHFTVAVSADGTRQPLGVLEMTSWLRDGRKGQQSTAQRRDADDNESRRWVTQVETVENKLPSGVQAIHVMDREADSFRLLAALTDRAFVIRALHDRVVELPPEHRVGRRERLRDVLSQAPIVIEREVRLSRRVPKPKQRLSATNPPREERMARLGIRASTIVLPRPKDAEPALPKTLRINVVSAVELDPPAGEKPVEWVLLTSLPIDSPSDIAAIVDHYRARWIIEEFFKALKTGCQFEERHFESMPALLNVLATLTPIAWQLLLLRHLARHRPTDPATAALTPRQLAVLREFTVVELPKHPTVRQAMLAVAQLGGHLRNNGEPGWQVLGRGFHDLLRYEAGWAVGRAEEM
jgi:Transposase DNA-binding/Transposase DDE domain